MSFSSGQKQLREKWVSLKRGCTVLQKCEIDNCQCDWVEGGGGDGRGERKLPLSNHATPKGVAFEPFWSVYA